MAKKIRNADYYKQRLKKDHPVLYRLVLAGTISVAEARRRAGLGGSRTRLHELKNAWAKASTTEQRAFLAWLKSSTTAPRPASATPLLPAFDHDDTLLQWARDRIDEIMDRRKIRYSDLADELGISRLNASIGNAKRKGTAVRSPALRLSVEKWLAANAGI